MTRPAALLLAALLPAAAAAQDDPGLSFTLGAGVSTVPSFFGSDENEVGPDLAFDLGYLSVGPLSFGSRDPAAPQGFGFRGSFRYVPERDGEPFAGPDRLGEPLDASFEVGGGVRYAQPFYEAFAVARYGIGGSEAVVGEVGLDLIARPTDRLALRAGPRLLVGSDDYADYYFSTAEDTDLAGPAFEAGGGLLASGLEAGVTYRLTERFFVEGAARYERLRGDAADSPITAEDDQFSASLAVTRRFDLRF